MQTAGIIICRTRHIYIKILFFFFYAFVRMLQNECNMFSKRVDHNIILFRHYYNSIGYNTENFYKDIVAMSKHFV